MPSAETPLLEWRLPEKTRLIGFFLFNDTTLTVRLCKYEYHEKIPTCHELERTFGRKQSQSGMLFQHSSEMTAKTYGKHQSRYILFSGNDSQHVLPPKSNQVSISATREAALLTPCRLGFCNILCSLFFFFCQYDEPIGSYILFYALFNSVTLRIGAPSSKKKWIPSLLPSRHRLEM
jgi:hypothetical protein